MTERRFDGVLLDIDGVLAVSWEPIPGAIDTLSQLRADGVAFRLITNTTTHSRTALAGTLADAGFEVDAAEIVTAVVATGEYLRAHHPGARVLVISDGDPSADLEGVELVGPDREADVVVIGGAGEAFAYATVNRAFQLLVDGAELVAMHRNFFWRTKEGLQLDGGAQAAGIAGVLVRTGKFRPEDLERSEETPDHVIDSIADLPALIRGG